MSDRFDASIKRGHQETLSNVIGRVFQGQVFTLTAQEQKDLGDLAGNLNYYASLTPAAGVEIVPYVPNDPDGVSMILPAAPGAAYAIVVTGATGYGGIAAVPSGGIQIEAKLSPTAGDFGGSVMGPNPSYTLEPGAPATQYFNVRLPAGYAQPATLRYFANVR